MRRRYLPQLAPAPLPSVQLWKRRSLTGERDRFVPRYDVVSVIQNHAVAAGKAVDLSPLDSASEAVPVGTPFAKYFPCDPSKPR